MQQIVKTTGLIYDEVVTKHNCRKKHPQKPQRVTAIMKALQQNEILTHPKIEYINKITRKATDQELTLAHSKKYVQHIGSLWPKTSHRSDMTILDSYYNQFTNEISRIAIGGLLNAVDKLLQEKTTWESAFAIIRPPGHHSGARNTINGFCVYNNVGVTAKYIIQKYGMKKVFILDWDVHHGDGTQHIFRDDPNVVFVSTHRYDRSTFYPASQQGDYKNSGQGSAAGNHINIPFNNVDQKFIEYKTQAPGDNQYIYAYNRIIQPIIRNYDPDFIIISAGFDAARGDPLGGFTITPNGYYYMTRKIKELAIQLGINKKQRKPIPVLLALEGGYSLKSTSQACVAVTNALLGDQNFPETYNQKPMAFKEIKNYCHIDEKHMNYFDQIIQHHSKNWKVLNHQEHTKYTMMIKSNKKRVFGKVNEQESSSSSSEAFDGDQNEHRPDTIEVKSNIVHLERKSSAQQFKTQGQYQINELKKEQSISLSLEKPKRQTSIKSSTITQDQIQQTHSTTQFYFAAGHMQRFKNFSIENPKIQKWSYDNQVKFYESEFQQKRFAPKYYCNDGAYITIENLLYNQKEPIIMDIKLSRISKMENFEYGKKQREAKKEQKSTSQKYCFRITGYTTPQFKQGGILTNNQQAVKLILKKVVSIQNKSIFINFLTEMKQVMTKVQRKYFGTSIVLIKGAQKSGIRWVDFHYWYPSQEYDKDLVEGIENLIMFISSLQVQLVD